MDQHQRDLMDRLERAGRGDLLRHVRSGFAQRKGHPFRVPLNPTQYLAIRHTVNGGLGAWIGTIGHGQAMTVNGDEDRIDIPLKRVLEGGQPDPTPRRSVRLSDEDWAELSKEGNPCSVARHVLEEWAEARRKSQP